MKEIRMPYLDHRWGETLLDNQMLLLGTLDPHSKCHSKLQLEQHLAKYNKNKKFLECPLLQI
jgi:hypothetical protein